MTKARRNPGENTGTVAVGRQAVAIPAIPAIQETRPLFRAENTRYARHALVLDRWPVVDEPWARAVEKTRVESVDHTPGAATFGR